MNKLFYGDNLEVLRAEIADESVDLIDPRPAFQFERFEDEWGRTYPKLQILTLAEMFAGKKPDIPFVDPSSIKRAKREDEAARKQGSLL